MHWHRESKGPLAVQAVMPVSCGRGTPSIGPLQLIRAGHPYTGLRQLEQSMAGNLFSWRRTQTH